MGEKAADASAGDVITAQLVRFRNADPPCRGVQLSDGVLRHTLPVSLYFYLKTGVENGGTRTQVFAGDSPWLLTRGHVSGPRARAFR